jgi:periplasmic copper chaperone A
MSRIRRLATVGVFAALVVGLGATPALAHVTVASTDAVQGGFGHLAFRVPTESETASTTKFVVQLPTDQGISSVSVEPVPGWTHKETTVKPATPLKDDDGNEVTEVVSTVEWTANNPADGIKPGEYREFSISAGPLPKAATLTFKAIQTYSDKTEVSWIEEATGGAEPEHPAPTLTLPAATTASSGTPASAAPEARPAPAAAADTGNGTATTALVIGILGLLAGLVGIGVAITSRRAGPLSAPAGTEKVPASRD